MLKEAKLEILINTEYGDKIEFIGSQDDLKIIVKSIRSYRDIESFDIYNLEDYTDNDYYKFGPTSNESNAKHSAWVDKFFDRKRIKKLRMAAHTFNDAHIDFQGNENELITAVHTIIDWATFSYVFFDSPDCEIYEEIIFNDLPDRSNSALKQLLICTIKKIFN